jgi:UDP-N-acetylmuramoylalanine--D-glutamate ligase
MKVTGKKFLIVGLARTGIACARFLVNRGAIVQVSDRRLEHELRAEMAVLAGLAIEYHLGGEDARWVHGADFVVPSPGVPPENLLLREAGVVGVPILSEIELACRFLRTPLLAITGTNGKSTTTTLLGEMLKTAGRKTFVGGNIGAPLIGFADGEWDWGVVEISSFQLEWVDQFRPRVAVLLNITEDHLDRYPDFAAYGRAKERIFAAQNEGDFAILNRDDPLVWATRERIRARVQSFGAAEIAEGVFTAGTNEIVWREGGKEERYSLHAAKLQGVHNVENMMAAIAAAKCVGIPQAAVQQTLETFAGLEHRLEFVREKDGVRYYNDSKGTNVGALMKSLASFPAPVILLAGGVDKGGDYGVLRDLVRSKVRRLVLFGAAKEIIRAALGGLTDTVVVETFEAAVADAASQARPGEVVLLSPACSSFDMFRNYAERGKVFKNLVQAL